MAALLPRDDSRLTQLCRTESRRLKAVKSLLAARTDASLLVDQRTAAGICAGFASSESACLGSDVTLIALWVEDFR